MKSLVALAALALLAGCEKPLPSEPPPGAFADDNKEWERDPGPKPLLVTRTDLSGAPDALVEGVLQLKGPCAGYADAVGKEYVLVTGAGLPVKFDSMGWFLAVGGDRLRNGATIAGQGGEIARSPDIPGACSGPVFVMNGIARLNPGGKAPPGPVDRSHPGKET